MTSDKATGRGRLEGRRIIVTGAASGIGLATARLFVNEGAAVALFDVDTNRLEQAAGTTGGLPFTVDMADSAAIARGTAAAAEALGGLDGVVNCAGIALLKTIGEISDSDWQWVLAVNLSGPFALCREALPWLRRDGGTIVNVASGAGLLPNGPGSTAYSASKAGLIGFTKALAAEVAPEVRVNALCPGLTQTPMTAFAFEEHGDAKPPLSAASYAMKRAAQPEEIAAGCLYLTSGESSFVTGSTLVVDGGRIFH